MQKSHLAVGLVAVAALVVGVTSMRSENTVAPAAAGYVPIEAQKPVLVTYSDSGFTPSVVKIKRGTSLRFINTSGKALRIAPVVDPAFNTEAYKGFESSQSVKRGDSFEISVVNPGVWGYKNLNAPSAVGVVIVE